MGEAAEFGGMATLGGAETGEETVGGVERGGETGNDGKGDLAGVAALGAGAGAGAGEAELIVPNTKTIQRSALNRAILS